jgi:hypothetical protein
MAACTCALDRDPCDTGHQSCEATPSETGAECGVKFGPALTGPGVEHGKDNAHAHADTGDVAEASDPGSSVDQIVQPEPTVQPKTRPQCGIRKSKVYIDGTVKYSCITSTGEPQNLQEALDDKN